MPPKKTDAKPTKTPSQMAATLGSRKAKKSPAAPDVSQMAAALGAIGGSRQVPKGFAKMSKTRRRMIAKEAAHKRWAKQRAAEAKDT